MGAYLSVTKPPIFLFDHWILESWNFRHFQKKFDKFWAVGVSKLIKFFFFWKNRKNDEKFFSLFLFVLCSTSCIVFPRLDIMLEKPFYLSKESIERSNHILKIICKTIKNHEKSRKSQKYQSQYFLWKMIINGWISW